METPSEKQHPAPNLVDLFITFLRLGVTAFGGPAMIPYVGEFIIKRKKWIDPQTFKGGVILAQTIPGATLMQTIAYVGLRLKGLPGAIISYVAFGLPAFILMLVFSAIYVAYGSLPRVTSIFSGLQVIVIAIVGNATYSFGKSSLRHYMHFILAVATAIGLCLGVSPFFVIFGAAVAGMFGLKSISETQPSKVQNRLISPVAVLLLLIIPALGLGILYFVRNDLFSLAILMLKVDLFAFGGGFASLPLMLNQVVHVQGWMDAKTFMDGIALGQVTPGPIIITAAFVGFLTHHIMGAVIATLAVFAPSFMMVILITPFFDRIKGSPLFSRAMQGILASFVGLLLFVFMTFVSSVPWNFTRLFMVILAFIAILSKIDLIYIVMVGAGLSLVLF
jgi:chromate transporter